MQEGKAHTKYGVRKAPCERQYNVELLNVGGNANNGANCGVAYANSNNDFSNSNTNIGARLKFFTKGDILIPFSRASYRSADGYVLVKAEPRGTRLSLPRWKERSRQSESDGVGYEPQGNRVPSRK